MRTKTPTFKLFWLKLHGSDKSVCAALENGKWTRLTGESIEESEIKEIGLEIRNPNKTL